MFLDIFFRFFLWVVFLFLRLVVFSYRYIHLYDLLESIARRLEWTLRFVFQQDEGSSLESPSVRKSELVHWSSLSNLRNDRVRALSAELSWTHGGLAYYLHGLAKLLSFIFVSLLTDRREHKSFCPRESLWSNDIRKSLRKEYLRLWTFSFFYVCDGGCYITVFVCTSWKTKQHAFARAYSWWQANRQGTIF